MNCGSSGSTPVKTHASLFDDDGSLWSLGNTAGHGLVVCPRHGNRVSWSVRPCARDDWGKERGLGPVFRCLPKTRKNSNHVPFEAEPVISVGSNPVGPTLLRVRAAGAERSP